ncbi:hypothetical protein HOY82DRAFT_616618 [Tuber indicum]|nr:hypothetical protein HOY82DRAFT_616618 [Tuber indicum]
MHFSTRIITAIFLILTSSLQNSPIQANGYWTIVSLRIEGSAHTIYEDCVSTAGNIVTTKSGGTHMCDGTNGGAHTTPGGTIISAVDDAVDTWDGTWSKTMREYFITSINGEAAIAGRFWGLLINDKFGDKGGCQIKVSTGDEVVFALEVPEAFQTILKARRNKRVVRSGHPVQFTVFNAIDGKPVQGARIIPGGDMTDEHGKVNVVITGDPGLYSFKATKDKTIRSPTVIIRVTPAPALMTESPMVHDAGFKCCN